MERTGSKVVAGGLGQARQPGRVGSPHLHVDKLGGTTEEQEKPHTQSSSTVSNTSKPLDGKNLWGLQWQEKLPASQKSLLEGPTGS